MQHGYLQEFSMDYGGLLPLTSHHPSPHLWISALFVNSFNEAPKRSGGSIPSVSPN